MTATPVSGKWAGSPLSPAGDKVRNFAQAVFGDGSVRVAYFEASKYQLTMRKSSGSYDQAAFGPEYGIAAGGGTPLNDSSVSIAEEPVTHSPRLIFHDESLGGLRFAETGSDTRRAGGERDQRFGGDRAQAEDVDARQLPLPRHG